VGWTLAVAHVGYFPIKNGDLFHFWD